MLCTEKQKVLWLECNIHDEVTDSIWDPGNKSKDKQGKDSQQGPLLEAHKGLSSHPEGKLWWETGYQTPGPVQQSLLIQVCFIG